MGSMCLTLSRLLKACFWLGQTMNKWRGLTEKWIGYTGFSQDRLILYAKKAYTKCQECVKLFLVGLFSGG